MRTKRDENGEVTSRGAPCDYPGAEYSEKKERMKLARDRIESAMEVNGLYSHNIIGLALSGLAKDCGVEAANQLIEEYDLDGLYGIQKVKPEGGRK